MATNLFGAKRIEVGKQTVVIRAEYGETRTIHLQVASHDRAPHTNQGHSIGRWENGALIVDTTRFEAHRLGFAGGLASSRQKGLSERFALSPDRTRLLYTFKVEDPEYLTAPLTGTFELVHRPDLAFRPDRCDPDVARRFLSQQ